MDIRSSAQPMSHSSIEINDGVDLAPPRRIGSCLRLHRPARLHQAWSAAITVLSWLAPLGFLAWAVRLAVLEGYLYEVPGNFPGDFTGTAGLGVPDWWTGQGIFYGPIFVLEGKFLIEPQLVSRADFARLDYALFGIAFVCTWAALFGLERPRLALWVLAAWLAHHASVEAFSNTAHLEVLELALLGGALLFAVRNRDARAGTLIGLAAATKTLPALLLPYLAIRRQWTMLAWASLVGGSVLLVVCWLQQIAPWDAVVALVYQGGNLDKLTLTEYEYTLRADIGRMLASDGTLSPDQERLAIGLHWLLGGAALAFAGWVVQHTPRRPARYGLIFGMVLAAMLIVSPSAHITYYIFLLPAWTAILADLLGRRRSMGTAAAWLALAAGYIFTGFDQPFFLLQRLFGFGLVVPQNWLVWHLPTLALLLTFFSLAATLLRTPEPFDPDRNHTWTPPQPEHDHAAAGTA